MGGRLAGSALNVLYLLTLVLDFLDLDLGMRYAV